jgi:hypothetical protein
MDFLDRGRASTESTSLGYNRRIHDKNHKNRPVTGTRATGQAALSRRPRHAGLFEAVARLDLGLDAAQRQQLADWIREEYHRELGDFPLGFVAMCHLGPPLVDHRLDLLHSIVDHYAPAQPMPDPYQQARMLVRTGAYEFVEIYASGHIIPVHSDGTPVASGQGSNHG